MSAPTLGATAATGGDARILYIGESTVRHPIQFLPACNPFSSIAMAASWKKLSRDLIFTRAPVVMSSHERRTGARRLSLLPSPRLSPAQISRVLAQSGWLSLDRIPREAGRRTARQQVTAAGAIMNDRADCPAGYVFPVGEAACVAAATEVGHPPVCGVQETCDCTTTNTTATCDHPDVEFSLADPPCSVLPGERNRLMYVEGGATTNQSPGSDMSAICVPATAAPDSGCGPMPDGICGRGVTLNGDNCGSWRSTSTAFEDAFCAGNPAKPHWGSTPDREIWSAADPGGRRTCSWINQQQFGSYPEEALVHMREVCCSDGSELANEGRSDDEMRAAGYSCEASCGDIDQFHRTESYPSGGPNCSDVYSHYGDSTTCCSMGGSLNACIPGAISLFETDEGVAGYTPLDYSGNPSDVTQADHCCQSEDYCCGTGRECGTGSDNCGKRFRCDGDVTDTDTTAAPGEMCDQCAAFSFCYMVGMGCDAVTGQQVTSGIYEGCVSSPPPPFGPPSVSSLPDRN